MIEGFERAARERPGAGILAGKVYFADRPRHDLVRGPARERAARLLGSPARIRPPRRPALRPRAPHRARRRGADGHLARGDGGGGLLDEDLFAYVEDVDWALRVRARGTGGGVRPGRPRLASRQRLDGRRGGLDPHALLRRAQHGDGARAPAPARLARTGCGGPRSSPPSHCTRSHGQTAARRCARCARIHDARHERLGPRGGAFLADG